MKKEAKYQTNKNKSIRFTSRFPSYCFDYLNEHDAGNNELLELIQLGIETKKKQEETGVDLASLFFDVDKKKLQEINRNELVKKKFLQLAEWFLFSDTGTPPFQIVQPSVEEAQKDSSLADDVQPTELDASEGSLLDQTMQLLGGDDEDDDDE